MKDQIVAVELKRGDGVILARFWAGVLEHDEYIKADTSLESLQKLKPAFKKDLKEEHERKASVFYSVEHAELP